MFTVYYLDAKDLPKLELTPGDEAIVAEALATYDPAAAVVAVANLATVTGRHLCFRRSSHQPGPAIAARAERN